MRLPTVSERQKGEERERESLNRDMHTFTQHFNFRKELEVFTARETCMYIYRGGRLSYTYNYSLALSYTHTAETLGEQQQILPGRAADRQQTDSLLEAAVFREKSLSLETLRTKPSLHSTSPPLLSSPLLHPSSSGISVLSLLRMSHSPSDSHEEPLEALRYLR